MWGRIIAVKISKPSKFYLGDFDIFWYKAIDNLPFGWYNINVTLKAGEIMNDG